MVHGFALSYLGQPAQQLPLLIRSICQPNTQAALQNVQSTLPKFIVVLSDGWDGTESNAVQAAAQAKDVGITVVTVVGPVGVIESGEYAVELMQNEFERRKLMENIAGPATGLNLAISDFQQSSIQAAAAQVVGKACGTPGKHVFSNITK